MIILINSLLKMLHVYQFYNILVYSSYKSPIIYNNANIFGKLENYNDILLQVQNVCMKFKKNQKIFILF